MKRLSEFFAIVNPEGDKRLTGLRTEDRRLSTLRTSPSSTLRRRMSELAAEFRLMDDSILEKPADSAIAK